MTLGKINASSIDEMTEIVAGLVRQGVTFEVWKEGDKYIIELTGGC